jgi:nucleoid-associated protein YgaU
MLINVPVRRMSWVRLAAAAVLLAAAGAALSLLAPDPVGSARSLAAVQRLADTAGADAVVVRTAGLLGWLVWGWGALGLVLTAGSALPGLAGALARGLLRLAGPAAARRAAAVALGVGLGLNGVAGPALAAVPGAATGTAAPDWPAATPATTGAPDWPASPAPPPSPGTHVVARGECLWRIAAAALPAGAAGDDAAVAAAVHAWWSANAGVIGPDPDRLLPGQVLHAPAPGGRR